MTWYSVIARHGAAFAGNMEQRDRETLNEAMYAAAAMIGQGATQLTIYVNENTAPWLREGVSG